MGHAADPIARKLIIAAAVLFGTGVLVVVIALATYDPVSLVAEDDAEMNAAMQCARDSFPELRSAVASADPAAKISVKVLVKQGDAVEHVWLEDVKLDGTKVQGSIANDGEAVDVSYGDPWTTSTDNVSDWFVAKDGVMRGGFTIRVLAGRMSEDERKDFEENFPYRFADLPAR